MHVCNDLMVGAKKLGGGKTCNTAHIVDEVRLVVVTTEVGDV